MLFEGNLDLGKKITTHISEKVNKIKLYKNFKECQITYASCLNRSKYNVQNELISNLMPDAGFKIVGLGVYYRVVSSLLFKTV